jgi:hypothetical protein
VNMGKVRGVGQVKVQNKRLLYNYLETLGLGECLERLLIIIFRYYFRLGWGGGTIMHSDGEV